MYSIRIYIHNNQIHNLEQTYVHHTINITTRIINLYIHEQQIHNLGQNLCTVYIYEYNHPIHNLEHHRVGTA